MLVWIAMKCGVVFKNKAKSTQQKKNSGGQVEILTLAGVGQGGVGSICQSAAPTTIVNSFLAVVTRLLNQVQHTAVFIYRLIALARPHRLVSMRGAVKTVR